MSVAPPDSLSNHIVMEFRSGDPGAVQFGNFINYYDFNSAEERISLLPTQHWLSAHKDTDSDEEQPKPYLVLDVGCNSGVLSQLLWQHLTASCPGRDVHLLGIDLDETLIERANEANPRPDRITFACLDVMAGEETEEATGELPTPIATFLHSHQRRSRRFDAVCCFSLTMWVHLNHDDCGLQRFLRLMCAWSHLLVIEPQPWKCYQTAQRRMKRAANSQDAPSLEFPLFPQLKWRSNVEEEIQNYLAEKLQRRKTYESPHTSWKRKICFYR